jgi:uncharacterized protein YqeY
MRVANDEAELARYYATAKSEAEAAFGNGALLLEKYLPKGFDAAKLECLVAEAIASTGASGKKEMGKVIGALKQHPDAGLIDFGAVSKLIQAKLP